LELNVPAADPKMRTILFLSDQLHLRNFTAAYLRRNHSFVQEAAPGAAIDLIQKNSFDVVIADLNLPESITIIEVLAYHNRVWPEKSRILCTLFDSDSLAHMCRIINATYVLKPTPLKQILLTIQSFEQRSRLMPYE
jgi:DNA-binding response OmpR family regulator